eukprot:3192781-Pyramimonas_sp.AAC.1
MCIQGFTIMKQKAPLLTFTIYLDQRIRIIQSLKSTKPQAGFDQYMTKFEELADAPTLDGTAREALEAEPPQEG